MFPKQKDKRELRSNGTGRIIFGVAARHRCFDKATCPKQYFDVVTRQWTTWPIEKLTSSEFSPANPCTVCLFFPFFFLPPSLSLSLCRSTRSPFFLFFSSFSFFLFFLFFFFFFCFSPPTTSLRLGTFSSLKGTRQFNRRYRRPARTGSHLYAVYTSPLLQIKSRCRRSVRLDEVFLSLGEISAG